MNNYKDFPTWGKVICFCFLAHSKTLKRSEQNTKIHFRARRRWMEEVSTGIQMEIKTEFLKLSRETG